MYRVSEFNKIKHEKQEKNKSNEKLNVKTEYIDDNGILDGCKKYTKEEVIDLLIAKNPVSDFKYLCC